MSFKQIVKNLEPFSHCWYWMGKKKKRSVLVDTERKNIVQDHISYNNNSRSSSSYCGSSSNQSPPKTGQN